jgi:hypothetical protein
MRPIVVTLTVSSLTGALFACASEPPPTDLTRAQTLIEQAAQNGAQRYAAADLDRARTRLREARQSADDDHNDEAAALASEAAADAELALARADSAEAQRAAREIRESIQALRKETQHEVPTHITVP